MPYPANVLIAQQQVYCGPSLGELSGGNWMTAGDLCSLAPGTLRSGTHQCPPPSELLCSHSFGGCCRGCITAPRHQDSYLVDSASSHMLVSKIKPCMSKYKQSIL